MTEPKSAQSGGLIVRVTRAAVERPLLFLAAALLLSGFSIWRASHLEVRSDLQELLPSNLPSVQQVNEMLRRVGGDGTILVDIESLDGASGLKNAESFAPVLAKEFLALGPGTIRAVDENVAPIRSWYEEHWPLFLSVDELKKARDQVSEEMKKQKLKANPLFVGLDDEEPAVDAKAAKDALPEWLDPKTKLPRARVSERFARFVDGFMVHPDQTSLALVIRPAGTSLGVADARKLIDRVQQIVDNHSAELAAKHVRVGLGGTFPTFVAEYEGVLHDVFGTFVLVMTLVLASLFLFFRDLRSTVSLAFAILVAVATTFGITQLVIGYLNTQTAFLGAIVVGNGINYGLIYLARVQQLRWRGLPLLEACVEGARTTASATLLASAATSVSFGVLIYAANRGFRHFGFIGGMGMLLCWVATFTLVPALLAVLERFLGAPKPRPQADGHQLLPALRVLYKHPGIIAGLFGVLTAVSIVAFVHELPTAMERNLDNLSNDQIKGKDALHRDNQRANDALGKSLAGSIALLDTPAQADAFCDVIRARQKIPPNDKVIDGCETLSSVVPREQPEKLAVLAQIVGSVPDSTLAHLPEEQRARVREVRDQLAVQRLVSPQEAPPAMVDRFRERDGKLGGLAVVTARPDAKLEYAENLEAFVRAVRGVPVDGSLHDATGANVIFSDLLQNIEAEGPRTTFLSFLGVCLLVFLFFRKLRTSLEVLGSLFIGVLLMSGAAAFIGIKINFFNFIVYPITFGIAVDYGANVAARVHERKGDVLAALAEVGPAVALCSWTSIIGYGSLLIALNRALRSFGWYAMIGEVTTIVTALVLLPALLIIAERARARPPAPLARAPGSAGAAS